MGLCLIVKRSFTAPPFKRYRSAVVIQPLIMSCPYGTYQRALSSHGLTIGAALSNPDKFRAALMSRLSKAGKANEKFLTAYLASAQKHLENDAAMMARFRL